MKDITATLEEGAPRKRIRTHLRESELRRVAEEKSTHLDQLLALAAYKAEEIRADAQERPMDEEAALSGFGQNPFLLSAQTALASACWMVASSAALIVLASFFFAI